MTKLSQVITKKKKDDFDSVYTGIITENIQ